MKPSDVSAVVLFVQTIAQINRGEVTSSKDESQLRHEACQRFREHVRGEPEYKVTWASDVDELKRLRVKDQFLRWAVTQPGTNMQTLISAVEGTSGIDFGTEYSTLYDNVIRLLDILSFPHGPGEIDMPGAIRSAENLRERVKALQLATTPEPRRMGQFESSGIDYNSLVHLINNLWPVKL